jgi:hypothetical protein
VLLICKAAKVCPCGSIIIAVDIAVDIEEGRNPNIFYVSL